MVSSAWGIAECTVSLSRFRIGLAKSADLSMYASTRGSRVPILHPLEGVSGLNAPVLHQWGAAMGFQYGDVLGAEATARDPAPGRLNPVPSGPSLCGHFLSRLRARRRTIAAHRKDDMKIHEYQARKIFR